MNLKSQLHFHTWVDPKDTFIKYDPYTAIDKSAELGYDVISFTHHQKFIFRREWQEYALKKWIILIPWVEHEIKWKHVLVYNCDESIESVDTFEKLQKYKEQNPNIFIMAPHPFYLWSFCLRRYMILFPWIFDWVEYSWLYHKKFWKKANKVAEIYSNTFKKPLIWTSDVHELSFLDDTYTLVDLDVDIENLTIDSINHVIVKYFESIRLWNVRIVTNPLTLKKMIYHNAFFVKWWVKKYSYKCIVSIIRINLK